VLLCGARCGEPAKDSDSTIPQETGPQDSEPDTHTGDSTPVDTAPELRWTGTAEVQVVDTDGAPVEGAFAMLGGASQADWATTDASGMATVEVGDDGITDRWILAGMEGYTSGGFDVHETDGPSGLGVITIYPLPDPSADNPDYSFQPGGTSHAMDTEECGHCHPTKADDWVDSAHHRSANNSKTWDLYVGGATLESDDCAALGGWMAAGQEPGVEGGTVERCYLGQGVLPFLNDSCGGQDADGCDHPDQADELDAFGSCGDCHAPGVDGMQAGEIDLARATGVGFDEGVSCDLCHKIRSVVAGPAPGRDGSIQLQRPSEETTVFSQEFDPLNFGPYPDVVVAIMKGAYSPGMREAGWCSSCHEYARGSLRDDQEVDAERWPGGLPINETWSECTASTCADGSVNCDACHLDVLDEESSTYDISERDMYPTVDQGWLRAYGEIRRHDFDWFHDDEVYGLDVDLEEVDLAVHATVTVSNEAAGHALPTGHPMRQLIVLLQAVDEDGADMPAIGGQAVPDVGGYRARGTLGADVAQDGMSLAFSEQSLPETSAARFVRPSGSYDDYEGAGTGSFSDMSAEDKGLPIHSVLGEVAIASTSGGTVLLEEQPPDLQQGDIVYLVSGDDAAGAAGWIYAKVLVDSEGNRGVAHYRAVDMASDNRLAAQSEASSTHVFPLPDMGATTTVTARLLFRPYAAPIANSYGWETGDVEVATDDDEYKLESEG